MSNIETFADDPNNSAQQTIENLNAGVTKISALIAEQAATGDYSELPRLARKLTGLLEIVSDWQSFLRQKDLLSEAKTLLLQRFYAESKESYDTSEYEARDNWELEGIRLGLNIVKSTVHIEVLPEKLELDFS